MCRLAGETNEKVGELSAGDGQGPALERVGVGSTAIALAEEERCCRVTSIHAPKCGHFQQV
jgi:hypothetical protein